MPMIQGFGGSKFYAKPLRKRRLYREKKGGLATKDYVKKLVKNKIEQQVYAPDQTNPTEINYDTIYSAALSPAPSSEGDLFMLTGDFYLNYILVNPDTAVHYVNLIIVQVKNEAEFDEADYMSAASGNVICPYDQSMLDLDVANKPGRCKLLYRKLHILGATASGNLPAVNVAQVRIPLKRLNKKCFATADSVCTNRIYIMATSDVAAAGTGPTIELAPSIRYSEDKLVNS